MSVENENILIVYYSRSGNSKKIACELKNLLNCHIDEIKDLKNRKGIGGFIKGGRDALNGNITSINYENNLSHKYSKLILCGPIWAANISPALRTYILTNRKKFPKEIFYISVYGGSGEEKYDKKMEEIFSGSITKLCTIKNKEIKTEEFKNTLKKVIKVLQVS